MSDVKLINQSGDENIYSGVSKILLKNVLGGFAEFLEGGDLPPGMTTGEFTITGGNTLSPPPVAYGNIKFPNILFCFRTDDWNSSSSTPIRASYKINCGVYWDDELNCYNSDHYAQVIIVDTDNITSAGAIAATFPDDYTDNDQYIDLPVSGKKSTKEYVNGSTYRWIAFRWEE